MVTTPTPDAPYRARIDSYDLQYVAAIKAAIERVLDDVAALVDLRAQGVTVEQLELVRLDCTLRVHLAKKGIRKTGAIEDDTPTPADPEPWIADTVGRGLGGLGIAGIRGMEAS